jgi:RNA polymerase sigma factor (sigma-70 family)
MTEKQLLERFIDDGDQEAFKALVELHGPMVLGVSRSVLHDSHDVEDAFQMAFLTLARSAQTIKNRDYIGPWLHRVALRIAKNTRSKVLDRRRRERGDMQFDVVVGSDSSLREFLPLLHEEMRLLPDRYRLPLVLCYLEGKTTQEAAVLLQCPVGTVKGRLSRARDRLRVRFGRRGLVHSSGDKLRSEE